MKMLSEADRTTVAAVSTPNRISEQSLYNWRKQYGDIAVDEIRRLRQLEQENVRLKKVLAERAQEIEILKGFDAKTMQVSYSFFPSWN